VKLWLTTPVQALSREWLLDEHQTVHAYFGAMRKDFSKWAKHPLLGPMDPFVLFVRHSQQVAEMKQRGYAHKTPLRSWEAFDVMARRQEHDLKPGWMLDKAGKPIEVPEMVELQKGYVKEVT
jgi:hypothetical protein